MNIQKKISLFFTRHPAVALVLAYGVGQGSVFLAQVIFKLNGDGESVGKFVYLLSFCSFAYQFSEFGTTGVFVRFIRDGDFKSAYEFCLGRAFWGFFLSLIFVCYIFFSNGIFDLYLLVFPLAAALFGFGRQGIWESRSEYTKIAIFQAFPWVLSALFFSISQSARSEGYWLVAISWLFVGGLIFSRKLLFHPERINFCFKSAILSSFPYIFPALGGQIWARQKMLLVQAMLGWNLLGSYGIVIYLQTSILILFNLISRPAINNILCMSSVDRDVGFFLKSLRVNICCLCVFSFFVWFLAQQSFIDGFDGVAVVFLSAPVLYVFKCLCFFGQAFLSRSKYLAIENFSLFLNVLFFFALSFYWKFQVFECIFWGEIISGGVGVFWMYFSLRQLRFKRV